MRDPLWLLTRQWQTGEFIGEDAGSQVTAKIAWTTDQVTQVRDLEGHTAPYAGSLPLEASWRRARSTSRATDAATTPS